MTLDQLASMLEMLPTVLGGKEELKIAGSLSSFSFQELHQQLDQFLFILGRLEESHVMGGVFDVDNTNLGRYLAFAAWLDSIANNLEGSQQLSVRSTADVFKSNPPTSLEKR